MGQIFDSIEPALDEALRLPHVEGDLVDKYDFKDALEIITNASETEINKRIIVASTLLALQAMPVSNKVAFCHESNMLYRYKADISMYVQANNTVITSNIAGGWVEHDAYNKVLQPSTEIALDHTNQSSVMSLTAATDFTAKADNGASNGHTHVRKLFCNGFTPSFSGFEFLADSSPIDHADIDISAGFYHTIVFFKLADVNRYIILEKVMSADTTPPTVTVSVSNTTDSSISYTVTASEDATMNWALYAGGSTTKSTTDIDAGTGALQHGTKSLTSGANSLVVSALAQLTTYDLWQYAFDSIPNQNTPSKTVVQTIQSGVTQLSAPVLGAVTALSTTSLSVPIAASAIDPNAESVSLFYKISTDTTYTEVTEINITAIDHVLTGLSANTQYNIYLVSIGDDVLYSDSVASNIATHTTQNIAPTLSVPYTSTNGLIIELPFSRAMANPSAQAGLFTLSGGKTVVSVALKSGDATKIRVTVNSAYINTDTVTISIASGLVPADNGVVFAGVSSQSVTNLVALNKSLSINNTHNYVRSTLNNMPASKYTDFSLSAWVKLNALPSTIAPIFMFESSTPWQIVSTLCVRDTGKLEFQEYSGKNNAIFKLNTTDDAVPVSQFIHLGLTNINGVSTIYFDGIAKSSINTNSDPAKGTFADWGAANYLSIGYGYTFYTNGFINDAVVFNRGLTSGEMLEIATPSNGKAVDVRTTSVASAIISYFRLNNSNVDAMGINTGSNVGTPVYSTDSII